MNVCKSVQRCNRLDIGHLGVCSLLLVVDSSTRRHAFATNGRRRGSLRIFGAARRSDFRSLSGRRRTWATLVSMQPLTRCCGRRRGRLPHRVSSLVTKLAVTFDAHFVVFDYRDCLMCCSSAYCKLTILCLQHHQLKDETIHIFDSSSSMATTCSSHSHS